MIRCDVYTQSGTVRQFVVSGHAGFRQFGSDIVCAAVSVLVINAINSCEALLGVKPQCVDEEDNLSCVVPEGNPSAQLLFDSMVYGLQDVMKQYPKHLSVRVH